MLKGKKGKKGFTLLELVIAIGLLTLFAVFIGVSLNRTYKKQKENDYNNFIKKIVASANLYVSNEGSIINSLSSNKVNPFLLFLTFIIYSTYYKFIIAKS